MMATVEQQITPKFTALVNAVQAALPQNNKAGRVIPVAPGNAIVWDNCCDGQITARVASMVPQFGQDSTMKNCGPSYWTVTGELTIMRCSQALENDGTAPAAPLISAEGIEGLSDTDVMLLELEKTDWVVRITGWTPQGPMGQCKGVAVLFTFRIDPPSLPTP